MFNHSWTKEAERNHHNDTYFGYSSKMSSPEKAEIKTHMGIVMDWTYEEQAILEDGLARYSSESSVSRYAKIASELPNKTIRDVAMRCKWIYKKEKNKRRKEDHHNNGSGRVRIDNKEIIDLVVASNSSSNLFTPSLVLREEDGIINELLTQNEQLLSQISTNLTSFKLGENLALLSKTRENITKLLNNMNENAPELMKHMPPLPEKLNHKLADSILLPSNLP